MREDRLNREKVFSRKSSVRKWHGILTCLAAVVVFGTVYSLILPAITMTKDHPTLAAEEVEGWSGDELKVRVTAETETSGKEKTFVLISESEDADIAPEYYFNEEGICVITDEEGNEIELHRAVRENKADAVDYWFTLPADTRTAFTLELADRTDPSRFAETVKAVREEFADGEKETAGTETAGTATASNAEKAAVYKATPSRAERASGSNASYATPGDAENVETETHDDGFKEILDGAVVNDLGSEDDEEAESVELTASLRLSVGSGDGFAAAVRDAERNADKRGDAQLVFAWKDIAEKKAGEPSLSAVCDGAVIAVYYDSKAGIPADASLSVEPIEEGTEEYALYAASAGAAVSAADENGAEKAVNHAKFFDITILDGDGNEIEPDSRVKVVITYAEAVTLEDGGDLNVVHFQSDDEMSAEVLKSDVLTETAAEGNTDVEGFSFMAESFSVYGIVYTVDFHHDGVDYSIPGSTQILLTRLINTMHITVPGSDKNTGSDSLLDINDVASVEFTSGHLVQVDQVSGIITINSVDGRLTDVDAGNYNFLLSSRKPFSTNEMLTITLKDGKVIEVGVTDAQQIAVEVKTVGDVSLNEKYYIDPHYWGGWHTEYRTACTNGAGTYYVNIADYATLDSLRIGYDNKGTVEKSGTLNGCLVSISKEENGSYIITLTKPDDLKLTTRFFEANGTTLSPAAPEGYCLLIKMVSDNGTFYALQPVDGSGNPSSLSAPITFRKYYVEWGTPRLGASGYYTGAETISTQVVTGTQDLMTAIRGGNGVVKYNENVIGGTQSHDLTKDLYSSSSAIVKGEDGNYTMTTTFVRRKNDGVPHDITVSFYTEKHAYPGDNNKLNTNPGLDETTGAYYFVVRLYNEGKLVAYKVKAANIGSVNSTGTFTATIGADETFTIVDDKGIDIQGSSNVKYDPTMYTSKVRLYKANNAGRLPDRLDRAGEYGKDVLPGYDFMYNKDWTSDEDLKKVNDGNITRTATRIGLYNANKKKYQVKVVVEDGTELDTADQLNLYVEAAHETTNKDIFGEAGILGSANETAEGGKRVYTILIEDQDQDPVFQKWTRKGQAGNTISGNEAFDLYVRQKSTKLENGAPIELTKGSASADALSGYVVTYDTDTLDENGIFLEKNVTTANGVTTITHYAYIKKVNYEPAAGPKDVLGGASEYGVVAHRYEQSGHTETNYAVHELNDPSNSSVNGAGGADIPFYVGKIDDGTKVWVESNTNNIYYFMTEEDKKDKIDHEFQSRIDNHPEQYNIITLPKTEIDSVVTGLINEGASKSEELRNKPAMVIPAAPKNGNLVLDTRRYPDGITIYVDCTGILDKMGQTGWAINKLPNQSIVFNIPGTDVRLAKMDAHIYDPKDPTKKLRTTSTGTSEFANSNGLSTAAIQWDQDIMRHITFNAYEAETLVLDTVSGAILAPNARKVTQDNGAGTIVTGGTVESKSEWHFYYQGRSWHYKGTETGFKASKFMKKLTRENKLTVPTEDQKFTFSLEELDNTTGEWVHKEDKTNNGSSIEFSDFKYTVADEGEHYYRVRELSGSNAANIGHDSKEYIVKVVVGVNISGTTVSSTETETYWYINDAGSAAENLTESYQTTVYDLDGQNHLQPVNSDDPGQGYKTREVTRYRIKSGYLTSATENQDGTTVSSTEDVIQFVNTYNASGSTTFNARKILKGKYLTAEAYQFELVGSNGAVLATAYNDADGNVTFDYTANYTLNDLADDKATFTYTIREKLPDGADASNNYTVVSGSNISVYDGHTATVTVTVTDNGDGTLKVLKSSSDNTTDGKDATFTNGEYQEIEVDKAWLFANESTAWPKDVTVKVDLMKKVGEGEPEEADTVTLDSRNSSHVFTNLPKYEGMDEIVYTVEEAEVTGLDITKYDVVISGDAAAGFHILNKERKAGLTITKIVSGKTLTEDEKQRITFTITGDAPFEAITRTLKDFTENNGIYTLELDQSNGIEAGRTYTVTETGANIEKYTRVTTVRVNGGEETTAAEEATASVTVRDDGIGAVVVTNKYSKEKTEISGRKTWIDGGRAHDDIGKEIVLHLERAPKSDTEQSDWELLADAVPEWKKENGIYTYTYSGLDKYTDADDQGNAAEYQYRVTEHSVNVKERAEDGSERVVKYRMETDPEDQNSFINTELTAFDFTKKWQNMKSEDQNTWPADREIEVKIVRIAGSEEDQEFALVYKLNAGNYSSQDGIEPDSEQSKGTERPKLTFRPGTEGTAFSFHLEGLTKFDGEKTYEYYVSETNQLEGYDMPQYFAKDGTPVKDGAALGGKAPDGGTIVNKESTGYELPSTGGTGTMLYTVSGMLLIGAVVLLKLMKHAARFLWT